MLYKNKRSGVIVNFACKIDHSDEWVPVETPEPVLVEAKEEIAPVKKKKKVAKAAE